MSHNARSRGWVFTINNPTGWDITDIDKLVEQAQYVIYGNELGENETPHYQGYVYFKSKKSFIQIKNLIPRAHIEHQKGSISQAIDYCKKDGNFFEYGTRPKGGAEQKNKWKDILSLAKAGQISEIESKYPDVYFKYTAKIYSLYAPENPTILSVLEHEWWVGPTGSGKSKTLWNDYPNHFQKKKNKWWDNYKYQEVVVIEEWDPEVEFLASSLKIWADRYPFPAEIKGGCLQNLRPLKIIVTSNYTLEQCFTKVGDLEPLKRRFTTRRFL